MSSRNYKKGEPELIPIVAIGASAGGLEPLELFFEHMDTNAGCAFVIIQHLSPEFRSLMDKLLAKQSDMPIHRVTKNKLIQPNHIYLNMPRSTMDIDGNFLHLKNLNEGELYQNPIDHFFKSLAMQQAGAGVALVLSGTGSDGTEGAEAVNKAGGTVFVQDPATSRFEGMPRSVINQGHQSLITSPAELAEAVLLTITNNSYEHLSNSDNKPKENPIDDILTLIKARFGTDLFQYKTLTIKRRIERRATMNHMDNVHALRQKVREDEQELKELYADLLIEVTSFFRDREAFSFLKENTIPELIDNASKTKTLRIWVPGCASGEEAYSVGILVQEHLRKTKQNLDVKIFATDIHERSMSHAQSGEYTISQLSDLPAETVFRYFECIEDKAQVKIELRQLISFSTHDVTRDPPFSSIDLICCRNLLIYLTDKAQDNVIRLLHFSLRKEGILFLGPSESLGGLTNEFDVINRHWRIFKKRRSANLLPKNSILESDDLITRLKQRSPILEKSAIVSEKSEFNRRSEIQFARSSAFEEIISRFAPAGFLLTQDANIDRIFGNAGELLSVQAGSFSSNIAEMIIPELKPVVLTALSNARSTGFVEFNREITAHMADDTMQSYAVALYKLKQAGQATFFMMLTVSRIDIAEFQPQLSNTPNQVGTNNSQTNLTSSLRISQLERSLQTSEENLQAIIEELETSNEELQSTNEELMSTNEELQSTNEELHSVNEELYTVSHEHKRDNDELKQRNNEFALLLKTSKIGIVQLDHHLHLTRYTDNVSDVFTFTDTDIGNVLNGYSIRKTDTDIIGLVNVVHTGGVPKETKITIDGEVFLLRILPEHTVSEATAGGITITVVNISTATELSKVQHEMSELIKTQNKLNILSKQYSDIVEGTSSIVVRWDANTNNIVYCNEAYATRWNSTPAELTGRSILSLRSDKEGKAFLESLTTLEINQSITNYPTVNIMQNGVKTERTALITTKALSKDGVTIDEYQSVGINLPENTQVIDTSKQ